MREEVEQVREAMTVLLGGKTNRERQPAAAVLCAALAVWQQESKQSNVRTIRVCNTTKSKITALRHVFLDTTGRNHVTHTTKSPPHLASICSRVSRHPPTRSPPTPRTFVSTSKACCSCGCRGESHQENCSAGTRGTGNGSPQKVL